MVKRERDAGKNSNAKTIWTIIIILIIGIAVALILKQTIPQQSPQFSPGPTATQTYSTPKPTPKISPTPNPEDLEGDCSPNKNPECYANSCKTSERIDQDSTILIIVRNGKCYTGDKCKCIPYEDSIVSITTLDRNGNFISVAN